MAKRARVFFQSMTELLDEYLKDQDKDKEEEPRKARSRAKTKTKKTKTEGEGKMKGGGRRKPVRDVNAPKKPLTAFMLYCGNRQKQMREANQSTTWVDA